MPGSGVARCCTDLVTLFAFCELQALSITLVPSLADRLQPVTCSSVTTRQAAKLLCHVTPAVLFAAVVSGLRHSM